MFRLILSSVIFAALVISAAAGSSEINLSHEGSNESHECGINQYWSTCRPLCPRTCKRPNNFCSLRCGVGCTCVQGTVLASPDVCVPLEKCNSGVGYLFDGSNSLSVSHS